MQITHTIKQTRDACGAMRPLALVPTLGALHEAHLALIDRAHELAEHVAVSIFVNPTQFGPNEDFESYPRPLERDLEMCREQNVDLVFAPPTEQIYPPQATELVIDVPSLAGILEGSRRPGHYLGVCRVVAKLFGIFEPQFACFGMKDYQQLLVVEAMAAGLCLPVHIERCPTVRDPDGLALSSRNAYLSANQRRQALSLHQALVEAHHLVADGETDPQIVEQAMARAMQAHQVEVEYAVVRHPRTLQAVDIINTVTQPVVCLVAGRVGAVGLIDNMVLG